MKKLLVLVVVLGIAAFAISQRRGSVSADEGRRR